MRDRLRPGVDFTQDYVFPGGTLPLPQILKSLGDKFGVPVIRERIFGQDYAKTLATWRSNFHAAWPGLKPLGFDDRFRRLRKYCFAYCEAGFLAGNIDVRQAVFAKSAQFAAVQKPSPFGSCPLGSPRTFQTDRQRFPLA